MKKSSFLIAGKHAVTEALKNPNRKVLNVLLTEDSKKKLNRDNKNLNLLEGVKLYYKNRRELPSYFINKIINLRFVSEQFLY